MLGNEFTLCLESEKMLVVGRSLLFTFSCGSHKFFRRKQFRYVLLFITG